MFLKVNELCIYQPVLYKAFFKKTVASSGAYQTVILRDEELLGLPPPTVSFQWRFPLDKFSIDVFGKLSLKVI